MSLDYDRKDCFTVEGKLALPYTYFAGRVGSTFITTLRDKKKIMGVKCPVCKKVYLPPRQVCERDFTDIQDNWVEVENRGTVTNFTIVRYDDKHLPRKAPYVLALIKLDGADTPIAHILDEVKIEDVKIGMRVEAVFASQTTNTILDIDHFKAAPAEIRHLQITPKADGIFALDAQGTAWLWDVDNPHPETTWRTIFGKVWYEGYNHPDYTWQSSSGNDDFEPKFSLIPLIFGTLKATVYSLAFAVPIALLAAIYTSQFLDKRLRPIVKSGIETMASLPSVVLGFVAALVLAPLVENWVVACLTMFAALPLVILFWGYAWQTLPQRLIQRYSGWPQFVLLIGLVLVAVGVARTVAGPVERVVFYGDFKAWLDGRVGTGAPGIAILSWPWWLALVWFAQRKWIAERLNLRAIQWSRGKTGVVELLRLVGILAVTTALATLCGAVLAGAGLDPRGSLVGTYVQRNTLVVGFVMGFAVIPIIYTISEDALTSVPEHLKSASLGCGATPWQTAVRVIVPVAMSGIFSAVMIGLGRAVGETMIVVMAAGNTPLLDANIFNGLRALSANIAVELPEAVKDSTLFRMLFLAALTLFVVTFIVNTVAEIIRQRFRKRAFQL